MTETTGFSGLTLTCQTQNAVTAYRLVNFAAGTNLIAPHTGTGPALGVAMQSGTAVALVRVLSSGMATVEFDNTPVPGNLATAGGDKAHDSGVSGAAAVAVTVGLLGRIVRLRADVGVNFADCFLLGPGTTGAAYTVAPVTTVTGTAYAALDSDQVILAGGTADTVITLPTAQGRGGRSFVIQKIAGAVARKVTIAALAGETVNGSPTAVITANFGALTVVSNGMAWFAR